MDISVVITCFNRQRMIGRAVRSVLEQTLQPLEIVVVDDGSHDDSSIVAQGMSDLVRVVRQKNFGTAVARNRGIEEAKGDWIAFLDSDDCWHQDKLSKQAEALEAHSDAKWTYCDVEVQRDDTIEVDSLFHNGQAGRDNFSDGRFELQDRNCLPELLCRTRIKTSAVMVRRDLKELHFPESIWGADDWAVWLSLALRYPVVAVDDVLVTLNRQQDNLITNRTEARLLRNQVRVLLGLMAGSQLTSAERQQVEQVIRERTAAAFQASLARGERREARRLLRQLVQADVGDIRQLAFWLTSYLPAPVANWMTPGTADTEAVKTVSG